MSQQLILKLDTGPYIYPDKFDVLPDNWVPAEISLALGPCAVHRPINIQNKVADYGFVVTHIQTGLSLTRNEILPTKDRAIETAAENCVLAGIDKIKLGIEREVNKGKPAELQ